jgi:transporter family protein
MQTWIIYAILSAVFAGVTAILAKHGLQNVHADVGLGVRTAVIFFLVMVLNVIDSKYKQLPTLTTGQLTALILSGVTTTLSWIFYYRAVKEGLVSYVAAIDKGSIIVTLLLSFFILREPITAKVLAGTILIFAGVMVLVWK